MLFKPELLAKVLSGEKTQTRRLVKPGETVELNRPGDIITVYNRNGRTKWALGYEYAACPGRGKVQQGRFKIKDIRHEDVRDISHKDAVAEGFAVVSDFLLLWIQMHDNRFYGQLIKRMAFLGYMSSDGRVWSMHWWTEDCELVDMVMERPAVLYDAWALTFEVIR